MRVSALLQGWVAEAAEQLGSTTVWCRVCDHLKHVLASSPELFLLPRIGFSKIMLEESDVCGF